MRNPWLSLWLSAANSWAGAMRGLWTAELEPTNRFVSRLVLVPPAPGQP
jgi:hypothetical protein